MRWVRLVARTVPSANMAAMFRERGMHAWTAPHTPPVTLALTRLPIVRVWRVIMAAPTRAWGRAPLVPLVPDVPNVQAGPA